MIAASEEFLREIAPKAIDGHLSSATFRGAAVLAGMRVMPIDTKTRTFVHLSDHEAGYRTMAIVFGSLAASYRRYADGPISVGRSGLRRAA